MVGHDFPADHPGCLDDSYESSDGYAGSRFPERGVICCDLLFKTGEAQQLRLAFEAVTGQDLNWYWNQWYYGSGNPVVKIDYLRCSSGGGRGWNSTAIVPRCCGDSWHSAQERVRQRQNVVVCLCSVGRGMPNLAFAYVVHAVSIAA